MLELDVIKAIDIDGLTIFIKNCPPSLVNSVIFIFDISLLTGKTLSWKTTTIVPICKKGNVHNIGNYRPVSLLCILSKDLEKCMFNHAP